MTGKQRQKTLIALLGAIVLFMGGNWLYSNYYETPLNDANARTDDLHTKIAKREQDLWKARKVRKQLEVWNARSLPADR